MQAKGIEPIGALATRCTVWAVSLAVYACERRLEGSNPHGISPITVFKTDKHANLASLLIVKPGRGIEPLAC